MLIRPDEPFRPDPLFIIARTLPWHLWMIAAVIAGLWLDRAFSFTAFQVSPGQILVWLGVAGIVLRLGWDAIDWAFRKHACGPGGVVSAHGVLSREEARIATNRIQARWVIAPLRERIFGLGSVAFASAGGGRPEVIWRSMRHPQRVLEDARNIMHAHTPLSSRVGSSRVGDGIGAAGGEPVVIGLAGGIGSGKSTVARVFADLGCLVSDSDAQSRAALELPEVRESLIAWWGPDVIAADGSVDRKAVGAIVFGDAAERARLEALVHPLVRRTRAELIEQARARGAPAVVVDAPLLFEVGLDAECDAVVFVDADRASRIMRVAARNGWDEAELDRREKAQLPLDEKRRRSDYLVSNTGDRAGLSGVVADVLRQILRTSQLP